MEFAHAGAPVQTFVFVTGDGDFIHLVNALRARGKRVVIIGTSWNTSWQLTSSADQFIPYDVDVDPATPRAPVKPAAQMPIDETFKVLADVVKYVREKRRPNVFAQVKLLLATRLGSFDEQTYGYAKFKDYMKEAERRGYVKTQTVGLTDRVYLPDEEIESGLATETPQEVESEVEEAARDGQPEERLVRPTRPMAQTAGRGLDPSDEHHLTGLVRFIDMLEQGSPFMSFNYIVNRSAESRLVPMTVPEISGLIDRAIQDGLFLTDTRTILDRITGEYRDINIFRLNRRHPLVAASLAEESAPEMSGVGGA
jgi:hypothetical protein